MNDYPDFYNPERIGSLFYPDMEKIAAAAEAAMLSPAAADSNHLLLLVVDMQIDFCHPQGALYVPGAPEDIARLSEFIFRHAAAITSICATLDSHLPFQIFHPPWWVDRDGNHPSPYTIISAADVESETWRPLIMPEFSRQYVQRLEADAKKQLTIWPFHVLIAGLGNALDPTLWSVIQWHALARRTQPLWLTKGRVPQSEHYSAVQPEINVPEHPQGSRHGAFLATLRDASHIVIAGEAESHCVLATLSDIVQAFQDEPDQLAKIHVLQDCMSPVVHPDVDFHALAQEQFRHFAARGVHFVNSTDALPFLEQQAVTQSKADVSKQQVLHLHTIGAWEKQQATTAA